MKILFVYPDIEVRGGARSFQFGIAMISAMLRRHGHDTKLCYMFSHYDPEPLRAMIASYQPDLLAFGAVSPQYRYVRQIFRDLGPFQAFTLLGGQHATLAPESIEEIPGLDAICVGEGEYPTLELVEALRNGTSVEQVPNLWVRRRGGGEIIRNPTRPFVHDLDSLPFPDRELFDYQGCIDSDFHTALFMFSRGCPYDCTFCSNHALKSKQEGRYVRFRSVANCLQEIREVTRRYQVKALYFNDDCFTARNDFLQEFCEKYRREFSYPFDINARPETLNDENCVLLAEAGCRRVCIGIEHGSEQFRREILGRRQSNDRIAQAFASCHQAGLKTKSFNIVGFPHETPELFRETVALNARINPDSVIIGIFEPYPGTRLAEICFQEGLIDRQTLFESYSGRIDTMLNMPQFPPPQIRKCFRNFGALVYRRHSPGKALMYKLYYAPFGQLLIRILAPLKDFVRKWVMGV